MLNQMQQKKLVFIKTKIMNIVAQELIGITVQTIYLKKSDTWLNGLYKGSTFIGVCWDFKAHSCKDLIAAAEAFFPKNINELPAYEKEFGERVTYHSVLDHNYFNLSTVELEQLRMN